jgi:hypothetical protein
LRLAMLPDCNINIDIVKTQSHLQAILYLNECEAIGMKQTNEEFLSIDKDALARSLWLSHRNNLTVRA